MFYVGLLIVRLCFTCDIELFIDYPRESFREGLWNHRRTFVCLPVCLFVCYQDN